MYVLICRDMVSKNKVNDLHFQYQQLRFAYIQIIILFSDAGLYRNVAKFLEKTFVEQREREEEEKVSLLQLCRGRTQKESASLFYETLVCPNIFTISYLHLFYCLHERF